MKYSKTIRFQYYQLKYCKHDGKKLGKSKVFNLVNWIDKMHSENRIKKKIEIGKLLVRIDEIKYDENNDLWALRLMKLRDDNIPSKVKEDEIAEPIHLEADEYIGEDMSILYEKRTGIVMLQCNRFSLSASRVREFIQFTNGDNDILISLDPIGAFFDEKQFKKGYYKNIDISFANVALWSDPKNEKTALSSIISPITKFGGFTGHITISLGRVNESTLNRIETQKLADEIRENKQFINSAKIKVKDDDDNDIEIMDLFQDVEQDFIEFTFQSRENIKFEIAMTEMISKYLNRRESLYKSVGYNME